MTRQGRLALIALAALRAGSPAVATAQDTTVARDSAVRAPSGAQFLVPLGSLFVPGLGQYVRGAPVAGAAFTATAVAGYALYLSGDTAAVSEINLPRHTEGQQAVIGALLATDAGTLSAYDAFRRALPALQRAGKYRFVTHPAPTAALLVAPLDPRYLKRWTTWADLAFTGTIVAIILSEREPGIAYEPYKVRDGAFLTTLSLSAGAGEEAMFRGWLLPLLHQNTGGRFWLANGIQAAVFGGLHVPRAKEYAIVIAVWAAYEGWLTRRNGWDVRESVFHHFWHDLLVGTAAFLVDERRPGLVVRFPTIAF